MTAWEATGSLVTRRGRLTPGQVVTAVAPIAQALADAHAQGLVHGGLTAADVHVTAEGKPVLDGLGLLPTATPQDDVRALAQIGLELLAPHCVGPVREVLLAAEDGDAADLATALLRACLAEPLRGTPALVPAPPARRRRWPVALAVPLVVALIASRVLRADSAVSWAAVLEGLDARRAAAFAQPDAALLGDVYVAGSTALAEDSRRLQALRLRHQTAHGLRHQLSVVAATAEGDVASLEVIASLSGYELRGPGGERRLVPAAKRMAQHLTLLRTRAGWRLGAVIT